VLPEHLMLEITEGALMVDPQLATRMLGRLAERGVQVAVDDFGTGQSSLAFLKGFALTTLKVDRAFIDGLPDSQTDVAICTAILGLARALGKRVVAEGVETEGQLQALLGMGVALMQGFYLGRPAPPQQIIAQLMAERARLPEPALAGTAAP
jgi:EAL domain-containing protein (putative c-di-GMP-specific phosphodiesterase class I)